MVIGVSRAWKHHAFFVGAPVIWTDEGGLASEYRQKN
jgi:hypothetical protein